MRPVVSLTLAALLVTWSCTSAQNLAALKNRIMSIQQPLLKRLLDNNYDANQRPPANEAKDYSSIIVDVNLYIVSADVNDDSVDVTFYLRQGWLDTRLQYDSEDFDHILVPNDKKVWMPDTHFAGSEVEDKDADLKFVRVETGGYVSTSQQYSVEIPCTKISGFPLINRMSCKLQMGSYSYQLQDVFYAWRTYTPVGQQDDLFAGRYTLEKNVAASSCNGNYTTGSYSCLEAVLVFDGGCSESLVRFYLPSIALLFFSWAHFWLHGSWTVPRSFSAFLPFTIFALVMIFADQPILEKFGFTTVQTWLLFCLILTGLSALEYFFVIFLGVKRPLFGSDAENPLIAHPNAPHVDEAAAASAPAADGGRRKWADFSKGTGVDYFSRLFFPLVFVVFLIVYLLVNLVF